MSEQQKPASWMDGLGVTPVTPTTLPAPQAAAPTDWMEGLGVMPMVGGLPAGTVYQKPTTIPAGTVHGRQRPATETFSAAKDLPAPAVKAAITVTTPPAGRTLPAWAKIDKPDTTAWRDALKPETSHGEERGAIVRDAALKPETSHGVHGAALKPEASHSEDPAVNSFITQRSIVESKAKVLEQQQSAYLSKVGKFKEMFGFTTDRPINEFEMSAWKAMGLDRDRAALTESTRAFNKNVEQLEASHQTLKTVYGFDEAMAKFRKPTEGPAEEAHSQTGGEFLLSKVVGDTAAEELTGVFNSLFSATLFGVPEGIVGLADMVTKGQAGQLLDHMGVRFDELANDFAKEHSRSRSVRAAADLFQKAPTAVEKAVVAMTHPWLLVDSVAQSLPSMFVGGAIGRGVAMGLVKLAELAPSLNMFVKMSKLVKAKDVLGRSAAIIGGGAGEGVISAAQMTEQIRQSNPNRDLTFKQIGLAALSGVGDAMVSMLVGKIANRLGIDDIDTMMAGAFADKEAGRSLAKQVLYGMISEGSEELPQSILEQVAQNIAQDKPWNEGVPDAAVLGFMVGAIMGGSAQLIALRHKTETPPESTRRYPRQPASPLAPAGFTVPGHAGAAAVRDDFVAPFPQRPEPPVASPPGAPDPGPTPLVPPTISVPEPQPTPLGEPPAPPIVPQAPPAGPAVPPGGPMAPQPGAPGPPPVTTPPPAVPPVEVPAPSPAPTTGRRRLRDMTLDENNQPKRVTETPAALPVSDEMVEPRELDRHEQKVVANVLEAAQDRAWPVHRSNLADATSGDLEEQGRRVGMLIRQLGVPDPTVFRAYADRSTIKEVEYDLTALEQLREAASAGTQDQAEAIASYRVESEDADRLMTRLTRELQRKHGQTEVFGQTPLAPTVLPDSDYAPLDQQPIKVRGREFESFVDAAVWDAMHSDSESVSTLARAYAEGPHQLAQVLKDGDFFDYESGDVPAEYSLKHGALEIIPHDRKTTIQIPLSRVAQVAADMLREYYPEKVAEFAEQKKDEPVAEPPTPTPAPSPKPVSQDGFTILGVNKNGVTVYEDQHGVRSIVENGVRQTEPMVLQPTRAGMVASPREQRDVEFQVNEADPQKPTEVSPASAPVAPAAPAPAPSGEQERVRPERQVTNPGALTETNTPRQDPPRPPAPITVKEDENLTPAQQRIRDRIEQLKKKHGGAAPSFSLRGPEFTVQVNWDTAGLGNTPNGQNINYVGFTTQMSPGRFLSLATRVNPDTKTVEFVKSEMRADAPIAPPMLYAEWDASAKQWLVYQHEGRHRSYAAIELGVSSMPVQVKPRAKNHELLARDITDEMRRAPFVSQRITESQGSTNTSFSFRDSALNLYSEMQATLSHAAMGEVEQVHIGGRKVPVWNSGGRFTQDDLYRVFQHPQVAHMVREIQAFIGALADKLLTEPGDRERLGSHFGLILDQNVHGVYVPHAYGTQATIAINPFSWAGRIGERDTPEYAAKVILETGVHELTHFWVADHEGDFVALMAHNAIKAGDVFLKHWNRRIMEAYAGKNPTLSGVLLPSVETALRGYEAGVRRPATRDDVLSRVGRYSERHPDDGGAEGSVPGSLGADSTGTAPSIDRENAQLILEIFDAYFEDAPNISFADAVRKFQDDYGDGARQFDQFIENAWKEFTDETQSVAAVLGAANGKDSDRSGRTDQPGGDGVDGGRTGREEVLGDPPPTVDGAPDGAGPDRTGTGDSEGQPRTDVPGGPDAGPGSDTPTVGHPGADPSPALPTSGVGGDPGSKPLDYVFTPERIAAIIDRGNVQRITDNLAALDLIRQIKAESRYATPAEQDILAKYVGWGASDIRPWLGIEPKRSWSANERQLWERLREYLSEQQRMELRRSSLNAHFTFDLYEPIWSAIQNAGFTGGKVLEPSAGTGHAFGFMPPDLLANSTLNASELEPLTAAIAQALYPSARVQPVGYQDIRLPRGTQDLVISNVPFGDYGVIDRSFDPYLTELIHNYFFAKAMESVRPGGLVVFVTSKGTMDAATTTRVRRYLLEKAHFVGAVRMPNTAFEDSALTSVVTDIVVMQRLHPGEEARNQEAFLMAPEHPELSRERNKIYRSQWYTDHPEFILGTESVAGTMYRSDSYTVESTAKNAAELKRQVADALSKILTPGTYTASTEAAGPEAPKAERGYIPGEYRVGATGNTIEIVGRDGAITDVTPQRIVNRKTGEKAVDVIQVERMKGLIGVRDARRNTIAVMRNAESTDEQVVAAQKTLNNVYDAFVAKYGRLNDKKNKRDFQDDPEANVLLGLEVTEPGLEERVANDGTVTIKAVLKIVGDGKADIFTKRTIGADREITTAATPIEALMASLGVKGNMDWSYMSQLLKMDESIIKQELVMAGRLFQQPNGTYVLAEEYLSGDVVSKLRDAEDAAEEDPALYAGNVAALAVVQPEPKTAKQITPQFGAHWIDPRHFIQFIADELRVSRSYIRLPSLRTEALVKWQPEFDSDAVDAGDQHALAVRYGHRDREGHMVGSVGTIGFTEMVRQILLMKNPEVEWTERHGNDTMRFEDPVATLAVRANMDVIRERWKQWVASHSPVENELVGIYNDRFNRVVNRMYDGAFLEFPGMSADLDMYRHQRNYVARGLFGGNSVAVHDVGAGKTYAGIALAMKMRQTGRANKVAIVAPTHLTQQWNKALRHAYPNAKAIVFEAEDLSKDNRQRTMAKIAHGDWDIVIMAHSSFELLHVSEDRLRNTFNAWVQEISAAMAEAEADNDAPTVRALASRLEKIRRIIDGRMERMNTSDDRGLLWEDLGIDGLIVDEAQAFKNNFFFTQMDRVRGLPSGSEASGRAIDMYIKIQDINTASRYRNVHFLTATPIMNSLVELYTMQRYLQPAVMQNYGISNFDNWMNMFGGVIPSQEQRPDGSYQETLRLKKFMNIGLLHSMFSQVADVVTNKDMPYLNIPAMYGGSAINMKSDLHPMYETHVRPWLTRRLDVLEVFPPRTVPDRSGGPAIHSAPDQTDGLTGRPVGRVDNVITVMQHARMAAIDLRLLFGKRVVDYPNSRVQQWADEVAKIYKSEAEHKGTILTFADAGTPKEADIRPLEFLKGVKIDDEVDPDLADEINDIGTSDIEGEVPFNLYETMREELIKRGIPSDEIAYIHQARKPAEKIALFDAMNSGRVRVMIASTDKGGTGMNAQKRMAAVMHFDAPKAMRPGDITQRDGRAFRNGNIYAHLLNSDGTVRGVRKYVFITNGTTDEWIYGLLGEKDGFIKDFANGQFPDVFVEKDIESISIEEARVAATGDQRLVELNELKGQRARLSAQAAESARAIEQAKRDIAIASAEVQDHVAASLGLQMWVVENQWAPTTKGDVTMSVYGPVPLEQLLLERQARSFDDESQDWEGRALTAEEISAAQEQSVGFHEVRSVEMLEPRLADAMYKVIGTQGPRVIARMGGGIQITAHFAPSPTGGKDRVQVTFAESSKNVTERHIVSFDATTGRTEVRHEGTLTGYLPGVPIPRESFGKGEPNVAAAIMRAWNQIPDSIDKHVQAIQSARESIERSQYTIDNPPESIAQLAIVQARVAELEGVLQLEGKQRSADAQDAVRHLHPVIISKPVKQRRRPQQPSANDEGEEVTVFEDGDGEVYQADQTDAIEGTRIVGEAPKRDTSNRTTRVVEAMEANAPKVPPGAIGMTVSPVTYGPVPPSAAGVTDHIRYIEYPELVGLAQALGVDIQIVKRFRKLEQRGVFTGNRIALTSELFKKGNELQLAAVLAHEIGHLVDYLPHKMLKRGNILGHLFSLKNFLKGTFSDSNGNNVKNADIRKELVALSAVWRPWDPKVSTEHFKSYRASSTELYADAISVLFNNPGLLKEMAPKFYDTFFDSLDRKMEVKTAYFELQALLSRTRDELVETRNEALRQGIRLGNIRSKEIQEARVERQEKNQRSLMFHLRLRLLDKNTPVIDKIYDLERRGIHVNEDNNPIYAMEERNYVGARQAGFVKNHLEPIKQMLETQGVTWEDFGLYLFLGRITDGDRGDKGNPGGIGPISAEEMRDSQDISTSLAAKMGPEKMGALQDAARRFRAAGRSLLDELYAAGMLNEDAYAQMKLNEAYAPFRVIEHMTPEVSWTVKKQVGTHKAIGNAADAYTLKMLSMIRAVEGQIMTTKIVDAIRQGYPGEVMPAQTVWDPKLKTRVPIEPPKEDREYLGLVTYYQNGKRVGVYMDKYIADSITNHSIGQNRASMRILNLITGAPFFRPLFTTFNIAFQIYNVQRDFLRFWKNTPDMSVAKAMKLYINSARAAKIRAFGVSTRQKSSDATMKDAAALQRVIEAEEAKVLSVTMNDLTHGREFSEKEIEDIFHRTGLEGYGQRHVYPQGTNWFIDILNWIKNVGDMVEALPKLAAIEHFAGADGVAADLTPHQRSFIRRMVGTPDLLAGGTWTPATNKLFIYSNAALQGIRTDMSMLVRRGPGHSLRMVNAGDMPRLANGRVMASGVWWKTITANVLPKFVMFMALHGAFGSAVRKMLERGATEYDLTNRTVIPFGEDAHGHVFTFRLPQDQFGQLIGGITWKILRGASGEADLWAALTQIADYTGGQMPTTSPLITQVGGAYDYMTGNNVYDEFRNKNVLSPQEQLARKYSWEPFIKYAGWAFQRVGGSIVIVPSVSDTVPNQTAIEMVWSAPVIGPILSRIVRITSYGTAESLNRAVDDVKSLEAARSLEQRDLVIQAVKTIQQLPNSQRASAIAAQAKQISAALFPTLQPNKKHEKWMELQKRIRLGVTRSAGDPIVDVLMSTTSTNQKIAALMVAAEDQPPAKFQFFLKQLYREQVLSAEALREVTIALRKAGVLPKAGMTPPAGAIK